MSAPATPAGKAAGGLGRFMDDRFTSAGFMRRTANKVFPDHWSFLLGEIALYSFIVLVGTGIFLTLYYIPSDSQVIYHGPYALLQGEQMSEAYRSVLNLSISVPAGLLFRQVHHWAADVFIAAIVLTSCGSSSPGPTASRGTSTTTSG